MTGPRDGDPRHRLGARGETAAESHLRSLGMEILARGWKARRGEVDLVAEDGEVLVFVEVKTRSDDAHGSPAEAVTPRKRRRLAHAALDYMTRTGSAERPARFDVVEVRRDEFGALRVTHLPDAFRLTRTG